LRPASPINRYSISARLYIQNVSPGKGNEANWLPAPTGDFILINDPTIIDGSYKVSAVKSFAYG
jgi:hypothetical protein